EAGSPDCHILVSTDDAEIADTVTRSTGLPVRFMRPAQLATDTAGSREVILHAMEMADTLGIDYDVVVLLQPTSPLRTGADITASLDLYTPTVDMVVSVTQAPCNPYYDCFETDPTDGTLHVSKGDGLLTRRQDAPPAWVYNGAIYVINPVSIKRLPLGSFPRRIPYVMPRERSIDLDTPFDWTIAEMMIKQ
ncbi:MAG: acylneuraminate cytidylyltransferase family protein, partial [Muribaculaceae bacterium]|nr:acylneuraminate cytidylyltransferase family protein [Muribaculaceae bacterium]